MLKPLTVIISSLLLAACTVGPAYQRPDSPLPNQFDQANTEASQQDIGTGVWQAFGDPALDRLVARVLADNTSIAQAFARWEEVRALRGLSPYSLFPTVTANTEAERSKPSGQDPFLPPDQGRTDNYTAGFDATWEIDLFGSLRNQKRAIVRRQDAAAAELQQMRLSIVAETAQAYFALRGAEHQFRLAEANQASLGESVRLVGALFKAGRVNELDLTRLRAQRSAQAAEVSRLRAEVVRHEQRLAALTGWPVSTLRTEIGPQASMPSLPNLVATGQPDEWLRRRPDVYAAERRLAAAYSDVGTEMAEFFPKLNLLGGFGWTAQSAGDLGSASSERWRWGPSLSWSFLDFGRVRQNVRAADARKDAAIAAYQETVLRALEETENALAGYRAANESAVNLAAAADDAREAARLSRLRFEVGADDALSYLDAERTRIDFEARAVTAETNRATALVQLYKALAGDFAAKANPEVRLGDLETDSQ